MVTYRHALTTCVAIQQQQQQQQQQQHTMLVTRESSSIHCASNAWLAVVEHAPPVDSALPDFEPPVRGGRSELLDSEETTLLHQNALRVVPATEPLLTGSVGLIVESLAEFHPRLLLVEPMPTEMLRGFGEHFSAMNASRVGLLKCPGRHEAVSRRRICALKGRPCSRTRRLSQLGVVVMVCPIAFLCRTHSGGARSSYQAHEA